MNLLIKQLTSIYEVLLVRFLRNTKVSGRLTIFSMSLIMFSCAYEDETEDLSIVDPASAVNWTQRTINSFPANNQLKSLSYKRGVCEEGNNGTTAMFKAYDLGAEAATYHYSLKNMNSAFPNRTATNVHTGMKNKLTAAYNKKSNITYYVQVSGTPPPYTKENVPEPPNGNFYPLPVSAQRTQCAKQIAKWMKQTEDALPSGIKIVWVGTQEPEHTLGKPAGNYQRTNINKFIDYWNIIATEGNRLKSSMKFAGIQANSGISSEYNHIKNRVNSTGLKSQIDFLSFQLYGPGGAGNDGSIGAAKSAASGVGKKMLVHRGAWIKAMKNARGLSHTTSVNIDDDAFNTSEGMLYYLRMESQYQARNGNIETYNVARIPDNTNEMWYSVFEWLQDAPPNLRQLNNLPNGVDGFVLANQGNYYAFLYNTSNNDYQLKLNLNTAQYGANARLSTRTYSGGSRTNNANYMTYNHANRAIMKVRLKKNDVVLVRLLK